MAINLATVYRDRIIGRKKQILANQQAKRDLIHREIDKALDVPYPRASKVGEAPRKRTGKLQRSTRVTLSADGMVISIGNVAPYAEDLLRRGRTWVRPTLDRIRPQLRALDRRKMPFGF